MNNTDLTNRVKALIEEVNTTHRYSMSRIYGLYNEVFERNETPQSCASCLIRKVKELQAWLDSQTEPAEIADKEAAEADEPQVKTRTKKVRKHDVTKA